MKRIALLALFPLLAFGLVYATLRYLMCAVGNTDKAWNIAFMIDQTCNVGANGPVDETISARAAKAAGRHETWGCLLCWLLDKIQPQHCEHALENQEERER